MSLAESWSPTESWPPHLLRHTVRRMLAYGWPVDDFIMFEEFPSSKPDPDPMQVFGLLVAPSRQLGNVAPRVTDASGTETVIYGLYPLTFGEFERYRDERLDIAELSEVIERWRDMLE